MLCRYTCQCTTVSVSRSTVTLLVITGLAIGLLVIYGLLEAVRSRILVRTGVKFDQLISDSVFKVVFSEAVARQATVWTIKRCRNDP